MNVPKVKGGEHIRQRRCRERHLDPGEASHELDRWELDVHANDVIGGEPQSVEGEPNCSHGGDTLNTHKDN